MFPEKRIQVPERQLQCSFYIMFPEKRIQVPERQLQCSFYIMFPEKRIKVPERQLQCSFYIISLVWVFYTNIHQYDLLDIPPN